MNHSRRHPLVAGLLGLLAAALFVPSAPAQGTAEAATRRLLDLERRMLAEDLAELQAAREAGADASAALDELVGQLDAAVAAGSPAGPLAGLEAPIAEATGARAAADRRIDLALAAVGERLRRLRLLAAGVGAAGEEVVPDWLTGRWQVTVEPVAVAGEFRLDQAGTLVSGSYRFEDGSRGSLEGTLVGGLLHLRRIDVVSGFDSVFEAQVDPDAGRLEGRWQATVLGRGGAGGGEWSAVRLPSGAAPVGGETEAGPGDLPLAGPDPTTPVGTEDSPPAGPVDEPPATENEEPPIPGGDVP